MFVFSRLRTSPISLILTKNPHVSTRLLPPLHDFHEEIKLIVTTHISGVFLDTIQSASSASDR